MSLASNQTDAALLDALLDAAADAIIVADGEGTIRRVNPAACALFGYAPDELLGRSINTLMPPEVAIQHDGYMQDHARTGYHRIIGVGRDLLGRKHDGTTFLMHISVGRAELDGKVHFVSIMHDLTRQRSVESALTQATRIESMGRMTSSIAHDFNNVLTVITGCLELLEMRSHDPVLAPLISDALRSAEAGARLVEQLMAVVRRRKPALSATDVNAALRDMDGILRRLTGTRIRLETRLPAGLPLAWTDPSQLESAVMNLVANACDAMPDGGAILISTCEFSVDRPHVAAETGLEPGDYIRLSVSDSGPGMKPEVLAHAFDLFFSTKAEGTGNGLGLAMVHEFARHSGGIATIECPKDRGTIVSLYLPQASQAGLQRRPAPAPALTE